MDNEVDLGIEVTDEILSAITKALKAEAALDEEEWCVYVMKSGTTSIKIRKFAVN